MVETRFRRRVSRNRKDPLVPLSKLRTAEVVRTVVDHPRRLEELIRMLEDRDRVLRGRAAATLARLSESHSARLRRVLDRLRESLADESAYVRWNLAFALGQLAYNQPASAVQFLSELKECLQDDHPIVRVIATRALTRLASKKPQLVRALFDPGPTPDFLCLPPARG